MKNVIKEYTHELVVYVKGNIQKYSVILFMFFNEISVGKIVNFHGTMFVYVWIYVLIEKNSIK